MSPDEPVAGQTPPQDPGAARFPGWSTIGRSPLTGQLHGYPHLLALDGRVHAVHGAADMPVACSTDGLIWAAAPSNLPYRQLSAATVHKSKLYAAGGYVGANAAVWEVLSSSDGRAWTEMTAQQIVPRAEHMLASHQGELLMIAGYECMNLQRRLTNGILCSEDDGESWGGDRPPAFSPRAGGSAVVFKDRVWVLGGNTARGPVADAWVRDDFDRTWSQPQPRIPWAPRYRHLAGVVGNTLYVGLGLGPGDVPLNDLWATDDGVHWRAAGGAPPGPPLSGGFAAAVFDDALLVIDCDIRPGAPDGAIYRYQPLG